jgi:alpha-ketoglutarate-dependent taurine dioxygenase
MSRQETKQSSGLGSVRRRAVDPTQLVTTAPMDPKGSPLPLAIRPAADGVALAEWAAVHRDEVDSYLDRHGAVLFRGFDISDVDDFESVANALVPDLFAEYGDLPPESASARVYGSTPYPPDKMILFHNESAHLPTWPLRQFFFCVVPAQERGETPILDCRLVCELLDQQLIDEFEQKGLVYVRNFAEGFDVPWQDFFKTSDRAKVERVCAESGIEYEWTPVGLRLRQHSPAVTRHPRTGERLFFNQIQLHHVACLDPETRDSLRALFAEDDMPRNVYFGDGTLIPDDVLDRIGVIYEEACVEFSWERGDMLAVDNMIVAHARRPYVGPRKMLVAMGQMVGSEQAAAN